MFLATKAIFKKYVLISNEFSLENITVLKPDSISKYFLPWIGQDLIDQIESYSAESNPIKKIKFTYKHSNPEQVRELIVTKTNAKYIFGKESENGKIKCFKKNGINYI
jgi:hypothetical protein